MLHESIFPLAQQACAKDGPSSAGVRIMKIHGKRIMAGIALATSLGLGSGCQTYFPETGQTLPSGRYLDHPPQYFPPTPPFPLSREQSNLEQATIQAGQVKR